MEKFKASSYQEDIFKFIQNDKRNAVISAVAGSGKTTTLLKALEKIKSTKKILFLAFNKSIAKELKNRIGEQANVKILTVHGHGYNILLKNLSKVAIDNNKYSKIYGDLFDYHIKKKTNALDEYSFDAAMMKKCKSFFKSVKSEYINWRDFRLNVLRLCDLGRLHYDQDMKEVAKMNTISVEDGEADVAWQLIQIGSNVLDTIDFTDMIFLPLHLGYNGDVYDFVFIDECQDLNTCQRLLMLNAIKPKTGRFIAVGDKKQCIYSFAGADVESFEKLCNIENTIQLPLSVTYRCSKPIVNMVKDINPEIREVEKNVKGEIIHDFSFKKLKNGDMVLCRQAFPVVSLCIKLLSLGKKAHIIGLETGNFIINTITNTKKDGEEFTMNFVFSQLYHDLRKLLEKIMSHHNINLKEALEDPTYILHDETIKIIEALTNVYSSPDDQDIKYETPEEVIKKIKNIFSETRKDDSICLSTIHKSKGLEAERVFILHKELMPSKYAVTEKDIEQETNLRYVAYTRAKSILGFITDYDAFKQHLSQKNNVKEINESKHIGAPGMKMKLNLTIKVKKIVNGKY
jgi:DNA helicase-2/ATP-dependent DNA helicase PcrA